MTTIAEIQNSESWTDYLIKKAMIEEIRTYIDANENNGSCDEYQLADKIIEIIKSYEV